jgi:hypothetical protein
MSRSRSFLVGVLAMLALSLGCADQSATHDPAEWMNTDYESALSLSSSGVSLTRMVDEHLIEDANGAPGSHQDITGDVVVRKELDVPMALRLDAVTSAVLEIHLYEAVSAPVALRIEINGAPQELSPGDGIRGIYRWRQIPVSPSLIRSGTNVITLAPAKPVAAAAWGVLTRRSTYPDRSARSLDGGRTWDRDHLSTDGLENGEYTIRLKLTTPAQGTVFSEIRALSDETRRVGRLSRPMQTSAAHYQFRTGPSSIPGAGWTEWGPLPIGTTVSVPGEHRYVQTALTLRGLSPSTVVRVSPLGEPADELADVNDWLRFGSRVRYQDPTHPTLRTLRERESLDRVVGSAGEELFVARLRDWVRRQFPDGNPDPYPPFNALTILDWIRSGKTQGFCGQHAFVLGHALLSYGYQIRHVELGMNTPMPGGEDAYFPAVHFALEYWSPTYRKWIFVDPNKNVRLTLNGTPLSVREIHHIYMEYFYPPRRRNPSHDKSAGDPDRVTLRPPETRAIDGLGTVRLTTWDIRDVGRFQVEHGPADGGGGWSLDYFYYVRARLRSDELMHPSQFHQDLPTISPRNADGFNPNGMVDFVDARAMPLRERIGIYGTHDDAEFDWRMDLVDVRTEGDDPVRIHTVTVWPYPATFVLRGPHLTRTSDSGTFELSRDEFSAGELQVDVLDTAGRVVASAAANASRR